MKEKEPITAFLICDTKYFPFSEFNIDVPKPMAVMVFKDRIEIIVQTFTGNDIKTSVKKFDYRDLLLMNETLNKILGPKK